MKVIFLNLFESFDPSVYYIYSFQFNWVFILMPTVLLTNSYWMVPSRFMMIFNSAASLLLNEFSLSMHYKKYAPNTLVFTGLMIYLMFMNFFSLFPYIFPSTSHLIFNLSLSVSLWLSFFIFSLINNPLKFFGHLVPFNSPAQLMNFMVLIELVSYMIRPLTLSIRLSSNLISGHLILILMSNFMMKFLMTLPLSMVIQDTLLVLEISMSVIQAYVFSILLALYLKES